MAKKEENQEITNPKFFKKIKEKNIKIKDKISGYDKEIVLKTFQLPNGMIENFFMDKGKDSVQVLAFTKNKEIILVEQYRPTQEKTMLELPGGGIEDSDEDKIKDAAKRELIEETAYKPGKIEFLHKEPYGLYSIGNRYTFVAFDCEQSTDNLDLDPNEFLKVKILSFDKMKEKIKKGKIRGWDIIYMALDKYNLS